MVVKDQFRTIKESYLAVFDDTLDVKIQKAAARNVVATIVESVYFEKYDVREAFDSIKKSNHARYRDSFLGQLNFLCDFGYIDSNLHSEYHFVYDEAGKHSIAHLKFKNGEQRLILVKKVFLNEILESFLKKSEESTSYIIPMSVISKDDPDFHRRIIERIDDFWNIRKGQSWFKKYQTVLAYFFGLFFTFIFSLFSAIIVVIGIYKTQKFVFDKTVKIKRYVMFGIITCLIILGGIVNNYFFEKIEDNSAKFDTDPFEFGRGFLLVSDTNDSLWLEKAKDTLFLKTLAKGEKKDIYIYHAYRNIGIKPLVGGQASLDIIQNERNTIIRGNLYLDFSDIISDSIIIKNINAPYHVEFIEGQITNERGKWDHKNCANFLYKKPLPRIYFENQYLEHSNLTYKGIGLNPLSPLNEGWCDAGYIVSRFRITKL